METKHLVCQGAMCKCQFGTTPDRLKVLTQAKVYINDPEGSQKLLASNMELGPTFEKNSFGSCKKKPFSPPCVATVVQWSGFYTGMILPNGGRPLLEDSKATCPIGGPGCIEIIIHGQVAEIDSQNEKDADDEVLTLLYPFGRLKKGTENRFL